MLNHQWQRFATTTNLLPTPNPSVFVVSSWIDHHLDFLLAQQKQSYVKSTLLFLKLSKQNIQDSGSSMLCSYLPTYTWNNNDNGYGSSGIVSTCRESKKHSLLDRSWFSQRTHLHGWIFLASIIWGFICYRHGKVNRAVHLVNLTVI